MNRLKEKYHKEIKDQLKKEFKIQNELSLPKISKVVINVGVGDAKDNQSLLERVVEDLTVISGQKPVVTKAKGAISGFKISKGQPIGVMVTLRGEKMYDFLDKVISVALPKVRDFRGLSRTAFDKQGNYNLGIRELNIFPEVGFQASTSGRTRGMEISIVTNAKNSEVGRKLLELLGFPFMEA